MNIEAACGCGAKVKIAPDNGGYPNSSYGVEAKTREEREACSAAFKEWVQAHASCGKSDMLPFPRYPVEPSPYRDGASGD